MRTSETDIDGHLSQILDLFAEDDRLNVYTGELEVRPPGAPTIHVPDHRRVASCESRTPRSRRWRRA
jgi:hypothetical protein